VEQVADLKFKISELEKQLDMSQKEYAEMKSHYTKNKEDLQCKVKNEAKLSSQVENLD